MSDTTAREREALALIGIARRAGRAVVGADAIGGASRKRPLFAIVVAKDAGGNAVARLGGLAREVATVRLGSRSELGRSVGKEVAALVGLTDRALADRVLALAAAGEPGTGETGSSERTERA